MFLHNINVEVRDIITNYEDFTKTKIATAQLSNKYTMAMTNIPNIQYSANINVKRVNSSINVLRSYCQI